MDSQKKEFFDLLLRYSQELHEAQRTEVEAKIWQEYGEEITVLVVDMSGFTRLTQQHGVVHYLSMVRRMQLTSAPIIEGYKGEVVKFEADNAFAKFPSPVDAIQAAITLNHALDAENILTPDNLDIFISCGIDHGQCLIPCKDDYYGDAVNCASKLGEDLAGAGQILVTARAMDMVAPAHSIKSSDLVVSLAEENVTVQSIQYRAKAK